MAAAGQFSWPPAGSYLAVSGQFLVAAVTAARLPHPRLPERHVLRRRHHQIHDAARGNPRAVNNLAIAALIATYAATKKIVGQSAARADTSEVISAE